MNIFSLPSTCLSPLYFFASLFLSLSFQLSLFFQLFLLFLLSSPLLLQTLTLLKHRHPIILQMQIFFGVIHNWCPKIQQLPLQTGLCRYSLPFSLVLLFLVPQASPAPSSAVPAEPDVSSLIPGFLFQSSPSFYPQRSLWKYKSIQTISDDCDNCCRFNNGKKRKWAIHFYSEWQIFLAWMLIKQTDQTCEQTAVFDFSKLLNYIITGEKPEGLWHVLTHN